MITVLMGAPGAGKSTWLKLNANGSEHIYDTHAVRMNKEIDVGLFMQQQRVKAIKAAESGLDLICDGTHTITTHRLVWLNLAKRLGIKSRLVIFDTSLSLVLAAQRHRQFAAPNRVVIDHYKRVQLAKQIVKSEPWDFIDIITR